MSQTEKRPSVGCLIEGYHRETRRVQHGDISKTEQVTVTDFCFMIDVTNLIAPSWSRIICVHDGQVYRYSTSTNKFKEYHPIDIGSI